MLHASPCWICPYWEWIVKVDKHINHVPLAEQQAPKHSSMCQTYTICTLCVSCPLACKSCNTLPILLKLSVSPQQAPYNFFFCTGNIESHQNSTTYLVDGFPTVGWFIIPTNQTQIVLTIKNKTLLLLPNRYSQYEIHVCCAHNNLWIIV